MKFKIFDVDWSVEFPALENDVNRFLESLPSGAVKHVNTASSSIRTENDQMQTNVVVTVWYETD